jgi:hypothetical protein
VPARTGDDNDSGSPLPARQRQVQNQTSASRVDGQAQKRADPPQRRRGHHGRAIADDEASDANDESDQLRNNEEEEEEEEEENLEAMYGVGADALVNEVCLLPVFSSSTHRFAIQTYSSCDSMTN